MGTRIYLNFHAEAVQTDAAFMQQMDALVRELGTRGQSSRTATWRFLHSVRQPFERRVRCRIVPQVDSIGWEVRLLRQCCDGKS